MPANTPENIRAAYGTANLVATCYTGKKYEKEGTGYNYDDIREACDAPPAIECTCGDITQQLECRKHPRSAIEVALHSSAEGQHG